MPVDESIERPIGDDALEPEACLYAFLGENRVNLHVQDFTFDTERHLVADLQAQLLRLAVLNGQPRRIGRCLRPPRTGNNGDGQLGLGDTSTRWRFTDQCCPLP